MTNTSILRKSCALTLGHKHKIKSAAQVFKKYGPYLKIKNKISVEIARLFYPDSLKTKITFSNNSSFQYSNIMEAELDFVKGSNQRNIKTVEQCKFENCTATDNLHSHHIHRIGKLYKRKDLLEHEKYLRRRKRKVVMLCPKHHSFLHRKGIMN